MSRCQELDFVHFKILTDDLDELSEDLASLEVRSEVLHGLEVGSLSQLRVDPCNISLQLLRPFQPRHGTGHWFGFLQIGPHCTGLSTQIRLSIPWGWSRWWLVDGRHFIDLLNWLLCLPQFRPKIRWEGLHILVSSIHTVVFSAFVLIPEFCTLRNAITWIPLKVVFLKIAHSSDGKIFPVVIAHVRGWKRIDVLRRKGLRLLLSHGCLSSRKMSHHLLSLTFQDHITIIDRPIHRRFFHLILVGAVVWTIRFGQITVWRPVNHALQIRLGTIGGFWRISGLIRIRTKLVITLPIRMSCRSV